MAKYVLAMMRDQKPGAGINDGMGYIKIQQKVLVPEERLELS